ncbi:cupin domain-containing protein [Aquimarina sp. 2201CG5-10]|uniref:cupin domain-containing protein n=1 Tax=Aquimarina callyspongiae TaxID=3098150 RepID=UPI002AB4BC4F|nr:cupin domain-containing protein [Aquimarina sp. 2201CG5-10]MDY8135369.1 cupin domain-containing protein [Aquimarina sp. 2201CG5-10]
MKLFKENSKHYNWGDNCSGWHLVKSENLSVIEELMPPNALEQKHYHNFSEQYFHILKGTATFEIKDQIVEVEKGEGIHIPPQTVHRIRNNETSNLEFIVISHPSTRGDRINETLNVKPLNLNGKKFRSASSTTNGEVNSETIFHYRQNQNVIWATYEGGNILFGTLSGRLEESKLIFTYQHQNLQGDFKTGKCESILKIINEKIQLHEKWQWTCDDFSKGESVLEEIKTDIENI